MNTPTDVLQKVAYGLVRNARTPMIRGLFASFVVAGLWLPLRSILTPEPELNSASIRELLAGAEQGKSKTVAWLTSWPPMPETSLSVFEPGYARHYVQSVWTHSQIHDDANPQPPEDSIVTPHFFDISPAWLTATLLPLILFGSALFNLIWDRKVFATQESSTGRAINFRGLKAKAVSLSALGATVAFVFTMPAFATSTGLSSPQDMEQRWVLIGVTSLLYSTALVCMALAILVTSKTVRRAFVVFAGMWIFSTLLAPRLAETAADYLVRSSSRYSSDEATTLDADQGVNTPATLKGNYKTANDGRKLEGRPANYLNAPLAIGEAQGNRAPDGHFDEQRESDLRQRAIWRIAGIFSPTIAFRNATAAFAGTDDAHYLHFVNASATYGRMVVQTLNRDIRINAKSADFTYLAGPPSWTEIPDFSYDVPPWTVSSGALIDLAVLCGWIASSSAAAIIGARRRKSE
jgi:ABC-2 type transport system permease protein